MANTQIFVTDGNNTYTANVNVEISEVLEKIANLFADNNANNDNADNDNADNDKSFNVREYLIQSNLCDQIEEKTDMVQRMVEELATATDETAKEIIDNLCKMRKESPEQFAFLLAFYHAHYIE